MRAEIEPNSNFCHPWLHLYNSTWTKLELTFTFIRVDFIVIMVLSPAGCATLIKSTISSIPYCENANGSLALGWYWSKISRIFIWGGGAENRTMHSVACMGATNEAKGSKWAGFLFDETSQQCIRSKTWLLVGDRKGEVVVMSTSG